MNNEAEEIASSIHHANSSALITEDYGSLVDHCYQLVSESKSILYVVVTKKNGFSIIHKLKEWSIDTLSGFWFSDEFTDTGKIITSDLINTEVFHKTYKVSFSGIDWGRIHIGLSLSNYDETIAKIKSNTLVLTIVMTILGFIIAFVFAKNLTKPITALDQTTKKIASGNWDAIAEINTGDELQSLAFSLNKMTDTLRKAQENLEIKVKERTLQLELTNEAMQKEIKERKVIETSLNNSLKEKDVLLKEIHHRVKNNLQIITSLLNLQASYIKDEENLSIFLDSQNRIKSMALVHEKLYQSQDFTKINFREYIINLSSYIKETYTNFKHNIRFVFELEPFELPLDTIIPLGLIFNELISNAYKYAFAESTEVMENIITITSEMDPEGCRQITIGDNGIGLPDNFDIDTIQSLGLKLVYNLCHQIEAELKIEINNGTKFIIHLI
jgi:two-component sensor histidine kinase/HAMP domain-containing protein